MSDDSGGSARSEARGRPGDAIGLRAPHLALVVGAIAAIWLANPLLGLRIEHPGALLLVPLAYIAVAAGTRAAFFAAVPVVAYFAYHIWNVTSAATRGPGIKLLEIGLYALSATITVTIVGRATANRRRRLENRAAQAVDEERTAGDRRVARTADLNQAILDSVSAHVAVLDPDGRIVTTNRAWGEFETSNGGTTSLCGVGSNYLKAARGVSGEESASGSRVAEGIEQILRGASEHFTFEYACHAPDEQRWFLLTATPIASDLLNLPAKGSNGDAVATRRGAVVSHIDITKQKQIEVTIRERAAELAHTARALKRTNEELDHFAYITSHDLRAPLRGIANLSQWIEEDMGERFTPEAHKQMDMLRGRVHRMEAMIDGILEYSRVGRVKLTAEPIDVRQLLEEAADLLAPRQGFTVEIGGGMPIVYGHKVRLQQVFMNLIGNAIKHHDKPTGRVVVECKDLGEQFEFTVADDGAGIEPQYFEKIFVIFQTLQPRDKVEGTGVGLSVVKKVVEGEGGTIAVHSEVGRGTTFRFTWPRSVEGASEDSVNQEPRVAEAIQPREESRGVKVD